MLKVEPEAITTINKDEETVPGETIFIVTTADTQHRFAMPEVLDFVQHQLRDVTLIERLKGR